MPVVQVGEAPGAAVRRFGLTKEEMIRVIDRWEAAAHKVIDEGDVHNVATVNDLVETWPFLRVWAPWWQHPWMRLVAWYYIGRHLPKYGWR